MIKEYLTKEYLVFFFTLAWFFYSCLVFSFDSCDLFMEQSKDGKWDVFCSISESDERGNIYENKSLFKSSIQLNEAQEIINDCIAKSELKMKKYGTVYNLKTGNFTIDVLLMLLICFFPFYLIYKLYIKNN